MPDVIVIGGGLSGLTAAWKLKQQNLDVRVLEAQDEAGGHVRTGTIEGFRLETGPSSFMGSAEYLWSLVDDLGLQDEIEPADRIAKRRYVFRDGRLAVMPASLAAFVRTPLLSWPGKLRLLLEPWIPNRAAPEETARSFFTRRFGSEAAAYLLGPFISGIYAGNPDQLGARAAFPKFWSFEREAGSMLLGAFWYMRRKRQRLAAEGRKSRPGLFSFRGGLGRLTGRLATELKESLLLRHAVRTITPTGRGYCVQGEGFSLEARRLVLSAPPAATAGLLERMAPATATLLRAVPLAPVAVVHWSQPRETSSFPPGFGFLVPHGRGPRVLGTLAVSHIFPGCAPAGQELFASFYGGTMDPEAASADDDHLWHLTAVEHRRILRQPLEHIRPLRILRHAGAIPQLLPDHPEKMAAVARALAALPGVVLAGNYLTGVSMEHAAASGYRAAAAARESLGAQAFTRRTQEPER